MIFFLNNQRIISNLNFYNTLFENSPEYILTVSIPQWDYFFIWSLFSSYLDYHICFFKVLKEQTSFYSAKIKIHIFFLHNEKVCKCHNLLHSSLINFQVLL